MHPKTWIEKGRLGKKDIKGIKGREWRRGIGGRQDGKQLTRHTKMQQAVTEANPVKTTTQTNKGGVKS